MADQPVTREKLINADIDVENLGKAVNELGTVNPRYGNPYKTAPQAIQDLQQKADQVVAQGFYKGYTTEALLLAAKPAVAEMRARADDTRKIWRWNRTSAEGVTPVTGTWTDTGLSDKDLAEQYSDLKISLDTEKGNILELIDLNANLVLAIDKNGKLYIPGLDSDIVSAIKNVDFSNLIGLSSNSEIFEIKDKNGIPVLRQDEAGDLFLPKIGNLTKYLSDLKANSGISETINIQSAHLAGKYSDYVYVDNISEFEFTSQLLNATQVNSLGVFPHPVVMLRIPAITRIGKTKYLLFFEARESWNDFGKNSQGVATIDVDPVLKTATVSNIKSLHSAFVDEAGKLRTFMNACAVKLDSGRIICLYVRRHGATEHQLYKRYSDDDGLTWSDYEDITSVKGSTGWNVLCPCSQGLVKRYGQHKGRVVFPLWTSGKTYIASEFRAGYIYSDDNGETWNLGEFADYTTANEVQCAEDLNGDMLFSIRLESRNPPQIIARYSDITGRYTTVQTNKALTNEIIMSGLIQGENQFDRTANKFQLSTCKNADRTELLVHTSYDGGENWSTYLHPKTIGKSVAYSCIENITPELKFLLWETGEPVSFDYSIVSLKTLLGG